MKQTLKKIKQRLLGKQPQRELDTQIREMCAQLHTENPHNTFVRDVYPDIYKELTNVK